MSHSLPDPFAVERAIVEGNAGAVVALLAEGADADFADEDGETPLHKAARYAPAPDSPNARADVAQIITHLLAHGADVSRRDAFGRSGGRTPLDVAYLAANAVAVRVLREAGATLVDVTEGATNEEKSATDLSLAVLEGDTAQVQALLRDGLDANLRDRYGRTALHAAAQSGNTLLAGLLISHGADPMTREDATGDDGTIYPGQGATPLYLAAQEGHEAMVRLLLSHGVDVDADSGPDSYDSPLEWAVFRGVFRQEGIDKQSHRTIQALLEYGADPLSRSTDKSEDEAYRSSALRIAAWIGTPETVVLLLEHCRERLTPTDLLEAMQATVIDNGHQNLVPLWEASQQWLPVPLTLFDVLPHISGGGLRVLLEKVPGLNIHILEPETGDSLLLWVARHVEEPTDPAQWEVTYRAGHVLMLLQRGANPRTTNRHGESPLSVARQRGMLYSAGYMEAFR